jgi:hypothetical protein
MLARLRQPLSPTNGELEASSKQDIVFIYDCTSAIKNDQLLPHQEQKPEVLLEELLTLSKKFGETYIVTNADTEWVLESARRFAPRVYKCTYERAFPGDVLALMRETFHEILVNRKMPDVMLNISVFGDSLTEMAVKQALTMPGLHTKSGLVDKHYDYLFANAPVILKTVTFKDAPSVEEFSEQLRFVKRRLSTILRDDKSDSMNVDEAMRRRPTRRGGQGRRIQQMDASLDASSIPDTCYDSDDLYGPRGSAQCEW